MDKPAEHPSPHGTAALRALVVCGLLGVPLLLAFGLGVIVWAIGLLSGFTAGLRGLVRDPEKGRAALAVALAVSIACVAWQNGAASRYRATAPPSPSPGR